jgi:hypothetical protein
LQSNEGSEQGALPLYFGGSCNSVISTSFMNVVIPATHIPKLKVFIQGSIKACLVQRFHVEARAIETSHTLSGNSRGFTVAYATARVDISVAIIGTKPTS